LSTTFFYEKILPIILILYNRITPSYEQSPPPRSFGGRGLQEVL